KPIFICSGRQMVMANDGTGDHARKDRGAASGSESAALLPLPNGHVSSKAIRRKSSTYRHSMGPRNHRRNGEADQKEVQAMTYLIIGFVLGQLTIFIAMGLGAACE